MDLVELDLQVLAGDVFLAKIRQHQVVVRAAGDKVKPAVEQRRSQRLRVFDDVFGVDLERRLRRLAQADGLACDHVHQRPALRAGEDGAVELLCELLVAREDHAAARAAQRLVRGGGDNVGVGDGVHMLATRDQTRDVCHVDHQQRAAAVRDVGEDLKIDRPGIGRRACHKELRMVAAHQILDLIVVDAAGLRVDAVADAVVVFAGEVHARAVGQVAAAGQIHAHERVAGLQQGGVDLQIRLRAGMRLHVGVGCAEERPGALHRNVLQHVDVVAAAVIPLARITLGVFVRQDGTHGGDDGRGGDVLRGDQLDVLLLTVKFVFDAGGDLRVLRLQEVHAGFEYVSHCDVSPYLIYDRNEKMSRPSPVCSLKCRITIAVAAALSFCLRDSAHALHLRHSTQ